MNEEIIKAYFPAKIFLVIALLCDIGYVFFSIDANKTNDTSIVGLVLFGIYFAVAILYCGIWGTRHFRLSEEGLHVYWYGIIHTLYPWENFAIHHVVYVTGGGNKFSGDCIIFSTKKSLMKTNCKYATLRPFSSFVFQYTAELYTKFKQYCPALTNHSARYADI